MQLLASELLIHSVADFVAPYKKYCAASAVTRTPKRLKMETISMATWRTDWLAVNSSPKLLEQTNAMKGPNTFAGIPPPKARDTPRMHPRPGRPTFVMACISFLGNTYSLLGSDTVTWDKF